MKQHRLAILFSTFDVRSNRTVRFSRVRGHLLAALCVRNGPKNSRYCFGAREGTRLQSEPNWH
jgi:hypothetical protein